MSAVPRAAAARVTSGLEPGWRWARLAPLPETSLLERLADLPELPLPVRLAITPSGELGLECEEPWPGDESGGACLAAELEAAASWLGGERALAERRVPDATERAAVEALLASLGAGSLRPEERGYRGDLPAAGGLPWRLEALAPARWRASSSLTLPVEEPGRSALRRLALEVNARLRVARQSVRPRRGGQLEIVWDAPTRACEGRLAPLRHALLAVLAARRATQDGVRALLADGVAEAFLALREPGPAVPARARSRPAPSSRPAAVPASHEENPWQSTPQSSWRSR